MGIEKSYMGESRGIIKIRIGIIYEKNRYYNRH